MKRAINNLEGNLLNYFTVGVDEFYLTESRLFKSVPKIDVNSYEYK